MQFLVKGHRRKIALEPASATLYHLNMFFFVYRCLLVFMMKSHHAVCVNRVDIALSKSSHVWCPVHPGLALTWYRTLLFSSVIVMSLAVLGFFYSIKPSGGGDDGSNTQPPGLAPNNGECSDITSPTVVTCSCGWTFRCLCAIYTCLDAEVCLFPLSLV